MYVCMYVYIYIEIEEADPVVNDGGITEIDVLQFGRSSEKIADGPYTRFARYII